LNTNSKLYILNMYVLCVKNKIKKEVVIELELNLIVSFIFPFINIFLYQFGFKKATPFLSDNQIIIKQNKKNSNEIIEMKVNYIDIEC